MTRWPGGDRKHPDSPAGFLESGGGYRMSGPCRQCGKDRALTSPVRRVEFDGFRKLALPAVAIGEKFRLVIIEFLAGLGGELEIRALDDGIDRASFLAQTAIDAFHHVDVVAHGAAGAGVE